eukprot:6192707-Pleurochrysis_carterae.AAC.1
MHFVAYETFSACASSVFSGIFAARSRGSAWLEARARKRARASSKGDTHVGARVRACVHARRLAVQACGSARAKACVRERKAASSRARGCELARESVHMARRHAKAIDQRAR